MRIVESGVGLSPPDSNPTPSTRRRFGRGPVGGFVAPLALRPRRRLAGAGHAGSNLGQARLRKHLAEDRQALAQPVIGHRKAEAHVRVALAEDLAGNDEQIPVDRLLGEGGAG